MYTIAFQTQLHSDCIMLKINVNTQKCIFLIATLLTQIEKFIIVNNMNEKGKFNGVER